MTRPADLTLSPAELRVLVVASSPVQKLARKCQCCGSTTELRHWVLVDLRLWTSCAACARFNEHVVQHLVGATEVQGVL